MRSVVKTKFKNNSNIPKKDVTSRAVHAVSRALITPAQTTRVRHSFGVSRDIRPNNIFATTRSKVPVYSNLDPVGGIYGEHGQEGQIIFNREDQLFYGHEGDKWQHFVNSEVIAKIEEEIEIINQEIVNIYNELNIINNEIDIIQLQIIDIYNQIADLQAAIVSTRNLIGFGTQVDIGGLEDFIPLDPTNPNAIAPNFIKLLDTFGFNVTPPPSSNDDIRVARRFQRLGNNISVEGSVSIRVGIESALYVTIILLEMIGLMGIIELISTLINVLIGAITFDIVSISDAFDQIGTAINNLLSNPLIDIPFNLPTISEKFLNNDTCPGIQYIVSEETWIGDCGGSVIPNNPTWTLPQIGKGFFSKLKVDIIVEKLQDLITVQPLSIPDTITIPTSEFGPIIRNILQAIINSVQVVINAFANAINSIIVGPINAAISILNEIPAVSINSLNNVNFGNIPNAPAINIPDINIPLNGIPVVDIINKIGEIITRSIELLTLTLGVYDISYDVFTQPNSTEIKLNMFSPLSSELIKRLYDMIKQIISIVSTALGNFKVPLELIRSLANLVVFVIQTFTIGEAYFKYSYRCDPNQIPGIGP